MVSCIFTCTNDLDAEFPAVAARAARPERRAAPVRARDRRARLAPARHPADAPLLRASPAPRRSTSTCARRARAAPRPRGGAMSIEFGERVRRIPVYPAAADLRVRRDAREARLQRDAVRAAPAGARGRGARSCGRSTATPTPTRPCCGASWRTASSCPRARRGRATAPASCCCPRPRRCSSRAPRSSTRGRRSRSTRTWRRRRGARAVTCRSTPKAATTSRRWRAR